jgi:hypothetical protein
VIKPALLMLAMLQHNTPPDIAAGALLGAAAYGIPSHVMAGYLVSGHPGGRYSGRCGDPSTGGTCGPYRLHAMWARRCGYPGHWRHHRVLSSLIAGCMLSHSRWQHYEGVGSRRPCVRDHDYRAHPKSSGGARASPRAAGKVRRQIRIEWDLCGTWCRGGV